MKRTPLAVVGAIVAILGILGFMSLYTVHQTRQALVLQFGNPIGTQTTPGLKFKLPWQNVEYYDRRILSLDPPPQEVILKDQKRINVDSFARFKIVDVLEFQKNANNLRNFAAVFGNQLNAAVRTEIGRIELDDVLTEKRAESMVRITERMKVAGARYGVEVVDVRIGRTDLPPQTAESVYNRMRSDRVAQAAELRAIGEEQKLRIQAEADKDRTVIIAEAQKQSQILRGEGDGEKTRILNDAYGRDEDFFDLYRSLETLENATKGDNTQMVLSPESPLFKFFDPIKNQIK